MRVRPIVSMVVMALVISGCGWSTGSDLNRYKPELVKNCPHCDLANADLSNANLSTADLSHANLSGADLSYADLSNANLQGAKLNATDCYLKGRRQICYTILTYADFSGANLSGANLHAFMTGVILNGANLQDAKVDAFYLRGTDLTGAKNVPVEVTPTAFPPPTLTE